MKIKDLKKEAFEYARDHLKDDQFWFVEDLDNLISVFDIALKELKYKIHNNRITNDVYVETRLLSELRNDLYYLKMNMSKKMNLEYSTINKDGYLRIKDMI